MSVLTDFFVFLNAVTLFVGWVSGRASGL